MKLIDGVPFWDADSDSEPAKIDAVRQVEAKLGVALPSSYVELLLERNGGSTNEFRMPDRMEEILGEVPVIDSMWCVLAEVDDDASEMSLLDNSDIRNEWDLPERIFFFSGEPSYGLFFDFRDSEEAKIGFYCVDLKQDVVVADCFESWLEGLTHSSI